MANTLGPYNPTFYANEALIYLKKALGMAARVHVGFDQERKAYGKGDTITVKRPSTFTAQAAPSTAQDLVVETVSATLSNWQEVKFKLTDKELAYTADQIIADHISPAAYALADDIDQKLAALWQDVPYQTTLAASTAVAADLIAARKVIFDNKVPMDSANLFGMLNSQVEADLLNSSTFTQWQGAGDAGVAAQLRGAIGQRFGINWYANQNAPTQTAMATWALTSPVTTGTQTRGSTSLIIGGSTGSGTVTRGTIITISGRTDQYVVTTTTAMGGTGATLPITPAIQGADIAGSTSVTIGASGTASATAAKTLSLAHHRNAFGLIMARMPDFVEFGGLGMQIASVQDPVTGLAVRACIYAMPDQSEVRVKLDTLYAVKTLDPNLAVRIRAN